MDAYEALLRTRATRGRRIITVVCGAIAGLSMLALAEAPPAGRASAETPEMRAATQIASAREAIAAARKRAAEEQARFASAVLHEASAGPSSPSSSQERCSVVLPEATHLVHGNQAFPIVVVKTGDPDLPSPSVAAVLADVVRAEEHLDNGRFMEGILYANALRAQTRLRYDVVVVATTIKHPLRTSTSSFEPGEIAGRAYLYDFGQQRVLCAGDVRASSSRQINYAYVPPELNGPVSLEQGPRLSETLDVDLEIQLQRAIAHGGLIKTR